MSEIIKNSVNVQIINFFFIPFGCSAQSKVTGTVTMEQKNIALAPPLQGTFWYLTVLKIAIQLFSTTNVDAHIRIKNKSNATNINYFTTFLKNVNMTNFLLIFI